MHDKKNTKVIYSTLDARRLREMADIAMLSGNGNKVLIRILNRCINGGELVEPEAIPPNLVTMRSIITITDLAEKTQRSISLHYPEEAEPLDGKFSVLTPAGLALLGAFEGSKVSFEGPYDTRKLRVDKIIYQPEAQKHYHR